MSSFQPESIPDFFPDVLPRLQSGQRVRHKRYGYRGIVVDFDMACQADEAWYHANEHQPDPNQPWYHVLVHGSEGNTYAAEENLIPDTGHEPIHHPLLREYFDLHEPVSPGPIVYRRNDTLWPGWA